MLGHGIDFRLQVGAFDVFSEFYATVSYLVVLSSLFLLVFSFNFYHCFVL